MLSGNPYFDLNVLYQGICCCQSLAISRNIKNQFSFDNGSYEACSQFYKIQIINHIFYLKYDFQEDFVLIYFILSLKYDFHFVFFQYSILMYVTQQQKITTAKITSAFSYTVSSNGEYFLLLNDRKKNIIWIVIRVLGVSKLAL